MAYQTFGDNKGDSDSYGKLRALRLPDLQGKRFLDVGCNAGFFCGAALESGACTVVGIDVNESAIQHARHNFPAATFHQNGWDSLPDGKFDVVILLSALHYAEDQSILIRNLMSKVDKNGVLVLEVGIADGDGEQWIETERAIDTRLFPTMQMMQKVLSKYTYRLIGPSVAQAGDPNPRYVFHVWNRRPLLIACLGESGVGKSDVTRLIKSRTDEYVITVHLDDVVSEYSLIQKSLKDQNFQLNKGIEYFSDLSEVYMDICKGDILPEIAKKVAEKIKLAPLAIIEGGIPSGYQTHFLNEIGRRLDFDIWTLTPLMIRAITQTGASASLSSDWTRNMLALDSNSEIIGFVDQIVISSVGIAIVGWGYDKQNGEPIEGLNVTYSGLRLETLKINRRRRPDVNSKVKSSTDLLGFDVEILYEQNLTLPKMTIDDLKFLEIRLCSGSLLSSSLNANYRVANL